MVIAYNNPDESSYKEIARYRDWNLIIHGGSRALRVEQRSKLPLAELNKALPATSFLGAYQKDFVQVVIDHKHSKRNIFARGFSPDFQTFLQKNKINCNTVLLDISSLEVDLILHLLNFFHRSGTSELHALYADPQKYRKIHKPEPRIGQINQPPGYVSLRLDDDSSHPHVIIAGFDKDRALWFFDAYSRWQLQDCYALIGEPAHVKYGTEIASAANKWIKDIPKNNVKRGNSLNPAATRKILKGLYDRHGRLDIVPLGPKPMVLGMVQFYFSLPEEERNNVRILYDFPRARSSRTKGIETLYLINCLAK